jgi:hypothetical protein
MLQKYLYYLLIPLFVCALTAAVFAASFVKANAATLEAPALSAPTASSALPALPAIQPLPSAPPASPAQPAYILLIDQNGVPALYQLSPATPPETPSTPPPKKPQPRIVLCSPYATHGDLSRLLRERGHAETARADLSLPPQSQPLDAPDPARLLTWGELEEYLKHAAFAHPADSFHGKDPSRPVTLRELQTLAQPNLCL